MSNNVRALFAAQLFLADDDGRGSQFFLRCEYGIGAALSMNDHIWHGVTEQCAEIGHIPVIKRGGKPCSCGKSGCLETIASPSAIREDALALLSPEQTPVLWKISREKGRENLNVEDILTAARNGDNGVATVVDQAVSALMVKVSEGFPIEAVCNNINIHDNTFRTFGTPILSAAGVGNLSFDDNKIIKTNKYPALTTVEAGIILDGCRNASIKNNNWDADYTYTKLKTTNMKSTDYKNRTDYRSMLQKEARSDSSRFKYGTEPGFIADSNVVNSYNSVLAQAKQQSGSATQLSAKTLLENLIKARKVLDTATVVPLTTGWYYILAADSAAEATGARRALTAPDAATSPVWQEAIERDWHTVWHITRIDSTASVYDVRGPLFSAQNYATSLFLDAAAHSDSGQRRSFSYPSTRPGTSRSPTSATARCPPCFSRALTTAPPSWAGRRGAGTPHGGWRAYRRTSSATYGSPSARAKAKR